MVAGTQNLSMIITNENEDGIIKRTNKDSETSRYTWMVIHTP